MSEPAPVPAGREARFPVPAAAWTDPQGAATYCGLSAGTLANWRSEGSGPPFARVGRAIRYAFADLDAWMRRGMVQPSYA